ncbi:MAG: CBS domain-containing protein [Haloarculaceae archaeon]
MEDIFVARLMSDGVVSVSPDTLVEDAANKLMQLEISSLVVVDSDNHLEGILTTSDFVSIVAESQPKAETSVERYMTDQVVTVGAQDSIRDAADKMITDGIHHLPVVDEESGVIGMLSTTDLTSYLSDVKQPSPA